MTLLNPNLTSNGYSEDNFAQIVHDMGAGSALVRNSTKLVTLLHTRGIETIFRARGDDSKESPLGQNPHEFVMARHNGAPEAGVIALTNECGLPPELADWSIDCAKVAQQNGFKVQAYNAETSLSLEQWQSHETPIRDLFSMGMRVGIHIYGNEDKPEAFVKAYAPYFWLLTLGHPEQVDVSEFGYIVDAGNPIQGWLLGLHGDDPRYIAFLDHQMGMFDPRSRVYLFAVDDYPNDDQGRAEGFGVWQHPAVYRHAAVINQGVPPPMPDTTLYDMAHYLCPFPAGKPFLLGGLGSENCQSIQQADGWVDFKKNELYEAFYVTEDVVGRGVDTSSLYTPDGLHRGTYYIQYTQDASGNLKYGAAWAARQMRVGQVFRRNCTVIVYDYTGKQIQRDDHILSDLTFTKHLVSMTFPSGITVQDIAVLRWGGEEEYYYGSGYGLVGWKNLATGQQSFVTALTASLQSSAPIPTPRPVVPAPKELTPVPPTPTVPPPTTVLGDYTLTKIPGTYVNVRAQPTSNAADVGDLRVGDICTLYTPDSNDWVYVRPPSGVSGWVSRQKGAVQWTPVTVPIPPTPIQPVASIVDVSQYNGVIDWQKFKAQGVRVAIIRASIGTGGVDTQLARNVQQTALAGISAAYYSVFLPQQDGAAQAEFFYNTIKAYGLGWLTPFVDVELDGSENGGTKVSPTQFANGLVAFVRKFEALTGQKPGVYTRASFFDPNVGTAYDDTFGKCFMWVAHYETLKPAIPRCWCQYALWQFSSSGVLEGNGSSHIDLNRLP